MALHPLASLSSTHSHPCDDCATAVECEAPRVRFLELAPWICLIYREADRPPFMCMGCFAARLREQKGRTR